MDNNKILEILNQVKDPSSGKGLVAAKMIDDLKIYDNFVNFSLTIPPMEMKDKQALNFACIEAVQKVFPEANVNVHMKIDASKSPIAPKATPNNRFPNIKNIIAVASGKGGVGKSTVAVNLALGLKSMGAKVGMIDADLYGPSLPTMLGLKGERPKIQDIEGAQKIIPLMAYGMPVMSIGFIIKPEQAVVLRGPRLAAIIQQFFNDVLWPQLDYLIIDLPPGTGDIQLTLVQTAPVTGAVLVTTPQDVSLADAIKAMNMFLIPNVNVPILGVVENMSWFTPPDMPDKKYYIFGKGAGEELARQSESVLLGQLPIVEKIRSGGDSGVPAILNDTSSTGIVFRKIAEETAKQVAERNEKLDPTEIVKITTH